MGKKPDCFGKEEYACLQEHCRYLGACIQAVWNKKLERCLEEGKTRGEKKRGRPRKRAVNL